MQEPETTDPDWTEDNLTDAERERLDTGEQPGEFWPGTEEVAEEMDLSVGDVFTWDGEARRVVAFSSLNFQASDRDGMTLENPTITHPASAEGRPVGVPIWDVYKAWRRGKVSPGKLTVAVE